MLYYDRIDSSKLIDPDKSNNSKECIICYYWFSNHKFKFQKSTCNLLILCLNISDITVITVNGLIIVVLLMTLANLLQFIC